VRARVSARATNKWDISKASLRCTRALSNHFCGTFGVTTTRLPPAMPRLIERPHARPPRDGCSECVTRRGEAREIIDINAETGVVAGRVVRVGRGGKREPRFQIFLALARYRFPPASNDTIMAARPPTAISSPRASYPAITRWATTTTTRECSTDMAGRACLQPDTSRYQDCCG